LAFGRQGGKEKMYLACADTEIAKRQEATEKRCRDMIAKHHRKPWWRKIGRETELRDMILAEWSAFSKWMDDRIAFMRKANSLLDRNDPSNSERAL